MASSSQKTRKIIDRALVGLAILALVFPFVAVHFFEGPFGFFVPAAAFLIPFCYGCMSAMILGPRAGLAGVILGAAGTWSYFLFR
ncbi:MAG TPA: hypothetical protein VGN12_11185 [Pirellulales bacterium]|jgi:hypothetical protein